jgi:hypothetical protein
MMYGFHAGPMIAFGLGWGTGTPIPHESVRLGRSGLVCPFGAQSHKPPQVGEWFSNVRDRKQSKQQEEELL